MSTPGYPLISELQERNRRNETLIRQLQSGTAHRAGNGDPNGVVAGKVGDLYSRLDGGAGSTLYVKEAGAGTAGWAAK